MNKGDSIEKIKSECMIDGDLRLSQDKKFGYSYAELDNGLNDIMIVKNYLTNYIYKVKNGETLLEIMSRGFCVDGIHDVNEGDLIVLSRPKSIRYVVKPLESLDNISEKFGVSVSDVMNMNNLKTTKLFIGQILWI